MLLVGARRSDSWKTVEVPRSPVTVKLPPGWVPHVPGRRPVGYEQAKEGWNLQISKKWRRLIFYLDGTALESVNILYRKNDKMQGYRTADEYIESIRGRHWGKDKIESWKGFETWFGGRKHKPYRAGAAPKVNTYYVVKFAPREYLVLELTCRKKNFKKFAKHFVRVRESIKYLGSSGKKKSRKKRPVRAGRSRKR